MNTAPAIRQATINDVAIVAKMFDAYRMFYQQPSDMKGATEFISERLRLKESVILIAFINEHAVGFTQLFPIFTSVGMQRTWLLNDLYIEPVARGKGIASALLDAAKAHGKSTNSKWLMLQTGATNVAAQALYEKNGWRKENDLFYSISL
ncbi:GNAT family N-acetyltransferase [Panacibacter sp. DH6]|uniref:GNAT family N-acetyltransferase n=1 Tax=Panacibacter microcysteis TaxID=2793269 RepID=A0A931MDK7_9BACT|nr:GNAT family N-acetyltransferase [Panacibacter microcysteis]MBG9378637.1 GNAT family N-acetyltransferase [Panacibacter microcysteis]